MKKFALLSALMLLLIGCEKDFNTIIDPKSEIGVADTVNFPFSISALTVVPSPLVVPGTVNFSIGIADASEPIRYFQLLLKRTDSSAVPAENIFLFDNGIDGDRIANDGKYENSLVYPVSDSSRQYSMSIYACNNAGKRYYISQQQFNTLADKAPKVVSVSAPDTVKVTAPMNLVLAAKVSDADGLTDISSVYFKVTRPDGTSNNIEFALLDNGVAPDTSAGDAWYTSGITVNQSNMKGTYIFKFYVVDKAGVKDSLYHNLTIKGEL